MMDQTRKPFRLLFLFANEISDLGYAYWQQPMTNSSVILCILDTSRLTVVQNASRFTSSKE
jgi:hypothetical protein